jgi:hypothetical protein
MASLVCPLTTSLNQVSKLLLLAFRTIRVSVSLEEMLARALKLDPRTGDYYDQMATEQLRSQDRVGELRHERRSSTTDCDL